MGPIDSHGGAGRGARQGTLVVAAARFLRLLPALAIAVLLIRALELQAAGIGGVAGGAARLTGVAVGFDLVNLAKYLPVLFLLSLPWLLIRADRVRFWCLGMFWSALVLVEVALVWFFLTARVPLGADLFGYSWQNIRETVSTGARLDGSTLVVVLVPLAGLWGALAWLSARARAAPARPRAAVLVVALSLLGWLAAPLLPDADRLGSEDAYNLAVNKTAFFVEDTAAYLRNRPVEAPAVAASATALPTGFQYLDPRYPFLRREQTPDVLGPYFSIATQRPPNLVFLIVEGLGRSFSGPDAALGSFTPFLDELAGRSLYWDNFLAVQGRTFTILASVFGSLPFGDHGFNALGERMPAHVSLLSVLKRQGYRLNYYSGFDLEFDHQREFLERQGVDAMVSSADYGPGYMRSPAPPGRSSWGYADAELISRVLASRAVDNREPFVSVIATVTMHTPYTFPGQAQFRPLFEQRLDQLGIAADQKDRYRQFRDIYTSILYTDQTLRRFFEAATTDPAYANTIFIVTGDHRLPELPMSTRIERYHVPLYFYSPLLKQPARIKSVSSHFDIVPSLLALLTHNYGLKSPAAVTWIGSGLDMEPSFRNTHDIPLKQNKTTLVDFVTGLWFLSHDQLYALGDGMAIEPVQDAAGMALASARFATFRAANAQFARDRALLPDAASAPLVAYRDEDRVAPDAVSAGPAALAVSAVHAPATAPAGALNIEIVFANGGAAATPPFVPLVVLVDLDGREVSESYGAAMRLQARSKATVSVAVKSQGIAPGRYYLRVIPLDPDTGKPVGAAGRRISVLIRD